MAGFRRETYADALACLRDFPNNWQPVEMPPLVQAFRSKSDPTVYAHIEYLGERDYITIIDELA